MRWVYALRALQFQHSLYMLKLRFRPTACCVLRAAVRERRRDALDRLIDAHAIAAGAVLVTSNEADFRDYPGLQWENWGRDSPVPQIGER